MLDLITIGILAVTGVIGWLRGFIKSIFGLLSTLLAAILAGLGANALAPVLSQRLTEVGMKQVFLGLIPQLDVAGNGVQGLGEALQEQGLPSALIQIITDSASAVLQSSAATGEELREMIAQSMAQQISLGLTRMVLFSVLFFVALALLQVLLLVLDTVFRLPVLNLTNRVAGLIFGLVQGAFICGVVCVVVSAILMYTAGEPDALLTVQQVEQTHLFRLFYHAPIIEAFLFG